ncbi:unnamed protein product [Pelagomonas calceolata]|uniref:RING-CH-type domain-containing protein n=1 Tax=Pelagomonas calceolata TaxID=35677 RepID=A0A8J2T0G2_9STRA|nr:unnamed protein product [Pelagomonas calceolata]
MCKKIHRGGNAEQYHADNKYKEAVAEAVAKCADDTKGQTCYICTQALHWKTKEGLVRRCACRGTAGFAHVACLAEQAKILMDEADRCERYEEVKPFLRATIPEAARELGTEDATVLTLRINYASALISEGRSRDDLVEAVALLEELSSTARRVFGTAHPTMMTINGNLESARSKLASFAAAP